VLPEPIPDAVPQTKLEVYVPTAEAILTELRQLLPEGGIGAYLDTIGEQPATSAIDPLVTALPRDGYTLELRLASWLIAVDVPTLRVVPTFLSPWLPMERCLVVPLVIEGTHRGALIAEVGHLSRGRVRAVEEFAVRLCATVARADEIWASRVEDDPEGPLSASQWRVKVSCR
jgi:hypothetical protein